MEMCASRRMAFPLEEAAHAKVLRPLGRNQGATWLEQRGAWVGAGGDKVGGAGGRSQGLAPGVVRGQLCRVLFYDHPGAARRRRVTGTRAEVGTGGAFTLSLGVVLRASGEQWRGECHLTSRVPVLGELRVGFSCMMGVSPSGLEASVLPERSRWGWLLGLGGGSLRGRAPWGEVTCFFPEGEPDLPCRS